VRTNPSLDASDGKNASQEAWLCFCLDFSVDPMRAKSLPIFTNGMSDSCPPCPILRRPRAAIPGPSLLKMMHFPTQRTISNLACPQAPKPPRRLNYAPTPRERTNSPALIAPIVHLNAALSHLSSPDNLQTPPRGWEKGVEKGVGIWEAFGFCGWWEEENMMVMGREKRNELRVWRVGGRCDYEGQKKRRPLLTRAVMGDAFYRFI